MAWAAVFRAEAETEGEGKEVNKPGERDSGWGLTRTPSSHFKEPGYLYSGEAYKDC